MTPPGRRITGICSPVMGWLLSQTCGRSSFAYTPLGSIVSTDGPDGERRRVHLNFLRASRPTGLAPVDDLRARPTDAAQPARFLAARRKQDLRGAEETRRSR